jgi:hypothetical protein
MDRVVNNWHPDQFHRAGEVQRLRSALTDLRIALTEQERALDDWCVAMNKLGEGLSGWKLRPMKYGHKTQMRSG